MKLQLLALCLSTLCTTTIWGQDYLGFRFFGLSIHPYGEKENASIMPLRLDSKAVFVQNLGAICTYTRPLYKEVVMAKTAIGLYADCAMQLGGFLHIGLRGRIFAFGRHRLYGGIGPTLIFRKNWLDIAEYKDQGLFKGQKGDLYQYLFLWYGGEIDYRYKLNERWDLGVTFIPGYPDLMSLSVGFDVRL